MASGQSGIRAWPGWSPLDRQLAHLLTRHARCDSEVLWLSIACSTWVTRRGDVCIDLEEWASRPIRDVLSTRAEEEAALDSSLRFPDLEEWHRLLRSSGIVGGDGDPLPLILRQHRLYLARYRQHELVLARRIKERLVRVRDEAPRNRLDELAARWFDAVGAEAKQAGRAAASYRFCMITGGPGTGKTSTVVRLLGLLQDLEPNRALRLLLVAPTGKAAARLSESIRRSLVGLGTISSRIAEISGNASTVHGALAACTRLPDGTRAPLGADVLVLDEASMIDLATMRELMDAAMQVERLVVLGDPHQLASVEAGAVLAELSAAAAPREAHLSASTSTVARSGETALAPFSVRLVRSHRFREDGGIGLLAARINAGDVEGTMRALDSRDAEVRFVPMSDRVEDEIEEMLAQGSKELFTARSPELALAALERFRVLCAHRKGRWGVETWNDRVARCARQMLPRGRQTPPAEPILVTKNARELELHNGDLGILWRETGRARACFPALGRVADYALSRLPPYELAYVMSVHKSQGSEVDEVVVILPDATSPLLTRELLYTAVTRAKKRCTLVGTRAAVVAAVTRRVARHSGLSATLRELLRDQSAKATDEREGERTHNSAPRQLSFDFGTGERGGRR